LGYDLEIYLNKKTYLIEVKSTIGGNNQFEMGSTETDKARKLSKNNKTEYLIAFVTDTLDNPKIHWLPNPFSSKGNKLFTIKEVGARISFKLVK